MSFGCMKRLAGFVCEHFCLCNYKLGKIKQSGSDGLITHRRQKQGPLMQSRCVSSCTDLNTMYNMLSDSGMSEDGC